MDPRPLVYDLSLEDLEALLTEWGQPAYRARQVWHGLYRRLATSPEELTDLPKALRQRLEEHFLFQSMQLVAEAASRDGHTEKALFRLQDGNQVEAVLMRYERRNTACISTQAGCAMGCVFCATGQMGFLRNLTAGEIIEQVLYYARRLQQQGSRLTNVVVMGMGEPFHNYEATMEAIDRLNHPEGLNFGARRFTVSTVGLVPMIDRFAEERRQVNLAVSLHAASDDLRNQLIPINRRYPVDALLEACRRYVERTGRRVTFEWALIRDVNDGVDQAELLARRLKGLLCHVNLIPLNPTQGYPGEASPRQRAEAFRRVLEAHGTPCTIRVRRGIDIQAGCGQLATEKAARGEPGLRT